MEERKSMKKIAVVSDFHSGHKFGLTPPGWLPEEPVKRNEEWIKANQALYGWYEAKIKAEGPYDVIFVNGDCIEGKGKKSGGTELITNDLEEQSEMAVDIIRRIPKRKRCKIFMVRGTPCHVASSDGEDWENVIADKTGATIGEHLWIDVEGVIFDLKHHPAGNSSIPHGRHSGVAKDRLWNLLWAEVGHQPKAQVFLRSHVHHHNGAFGPGWMAMTTPALQGAGSKFGLRRCSGIVDYGFVTFQVEKGKYQWQPHVANIEQQKSPLIKL